MPSKRIGELGLVASSAGPDRFAPENLAITKFREADGLTFRRVLILNVTDLGERLRDVLVVAQPQVVVDIRYSPRFESPTLGRHQFFELIREWNAVYLDVYGQLQVEGKKDDADSFRLLFGHVTRWITDNPRVVPGGIVVLTDKRRFSTELLFAVEQMAHPRDGSWSVETYPNLRTRQHLNAPHAVVHSKESGSVEEGRRTRIFISHANPQDNDFALWLSAKLRAGGYDTWVDLEDLRGGATFWDEIEEKIRRDTSKFIFVQSAYSLTRPNVLNEVDLAISVERRRALKDFVVPIRVDTTPFDDTHISLRRKHVIDFSENWAQGLKQLLRAFEEDDVPVNVGNRSPELARSFARIAEETTVVRASDPTLSNWYEIASLPRNVAWWPCSRLSANHGFPDGSIAEAGLCFAFGGGGSEFNAVSGAIKTTQLLEAVTIAGVSLERPVARRILHRLVKSAWEQHVQQLGLSRYQLSGFRSCWFWPWEAYGDKRVKFTDVFGLDGERLIVGKSEKYGVYWHFALEAIPRFGHINHFLMRPHVVFTTDGVRPVQNPAVMHRLRRSFCGNWWNARWRDLIGAYMATVSDSTTISLGKGDGALDIDSYPVRFVAPVTPSIDRAAVEDVPFEESLDELEDEFELRSLVEGLNDEQQS